MSVNQRPLKTIQMFLSEHDYTYFKERNHDYRGRVFNDKGQPSRQTSKDHERDIYDIEGTLEIQRQLLSRLATIENQVMGEFENSMHQKRIETLRADTVQAIQKTWNQNNKPYTYQNSLDSMC